MGHGVVFWKRALSWAGAFCVLLLSVVTIVAEEPAAKPEAAKKEPAAEPKADPFALPETDKPDELLKFAGDLAKARPAVRTMADLRTHQQKVAAATLLATEKVLAQTELAPETALAAAKLRANALILKANNPQEWDAAAELLTTLPEHGQEAIRELKKSGQTQLRLTKAEQGRMDAAQLAELQTELFANVELQKANPDAMRSALRLGKYFEYSKPDDAVKYLTSLVELLKKSDNASAADIVPRLEGTIRRMKLPGNSMELTGTTLDDQAFDLASFKGKVVLVDFWATWCGPCIAEVPHVLKLHKALHEKGFEVVGISLDEDEDRLRKYVKKNEIPWVNLFPKEEDNRGWSNPIAKHYGISGIPTCILINAEGKVVSLRARGKMLDEELTKIFGPLPDLEEKPEAKPTEKAPAEKAAAE